MPQSLSSIIIHIIFTTRERRMLINESIQGALHAYIATVARNEGCPTYRVGGTDNHVHMACALSRTITVSKLVKRVKRASSAWMKKQGDQYEGFYWQEGYGAFSISRGELDNLAQYITNQPEHHQRVSFQEEYRRFLDRYDVEYDERYVWG